MNSSSVAFLGVSGLSAALDRKICNSVRGTREE